MHIGCLSVCSVWRSRDIAIHWNTANVKFCASQGDSAFQATFFLQRICCSSRFAHKQSHQCRRVFFLFKAGGSVLSTKGHRERAQCRLPHSALKTLSEPENVHRIINPRCGSGSSSRFFLWNFWSWCRAPTLGLSPGPVSGSREARESDVRSRNGRVSQRFASQIKPPESIRAEAGCEPRGGAGPEVELRSAPLSTRGCRFSGEVSGKP